MEQFVSTKMNRIFMALIISLALCFVSCEGDDGYEPVVNYESPYYTLSSDNTNMPSSGTIVAQYSDSPEGYGIGKIVDGDSSTSFVTSHSEFTITWNGNSSVAVQYYSLTSSEDSASQDPRSWSLKASTDNSTWKTLDTQVDQSFSSRGQTKVYEIEDASSYRYFVLYVEANNGDESTQIAEYSLSAGEYTQTIDDLMEFSSGNTYSSATPMGSQHASDRVATASDIEWLKDVNSEPDTFDGLSWSSFSITTLYPYGDPSPADVNQHSIGDCCACAVFASMAYLYPDFIKHIIVSNGNNTYNVSMYDPAGDEITVGVSNYFVIDGSGNLGAVSGKGYVVTWATILEKAMIKWCQVYKGSSNVGGIGTEYVTALFTGTGSSFAFSSGVLSATDLQRAAMVSLQNRQIVIGGFNGSGYTVDQLYSTVSGHAYGFYPAPNSSYLFSMRNPWGLLPLASGGYSDGKDDGLLYVADDGVIPSTIDLRICEPGAAASFAKSGSLEIYTPPAF